MPKTKTLALAVATCLSLTSCLSVSSVALNATAMTAEQAVEELKLTELANTYSSEKIALVTGNKKASRFDAVLITIGAISAADLKNQAQMEQKLADFVQDQHDLSENYMGYLAEPSLIERVRKKWHDSNSMPDEAVLARLNRFIDKGYTSGYNLFASGDKSNFNSKLMIRYGHSNIDHAVQLLYLMKSEGVNPKVQLTTKSSAFLHLAEWGTSSNPTYTTQSGKTVQVAKEYNLDFEFQSIENKQKFMDIINKYAKKDAADEQGLLIKSWWQPFYRSYTEMQGYQALIENQLIVGDYQADLMVLPENAEQQKAQINAALNQNKVISTQVWVNPSFYRYMQGEYK